MVDLRTLIRPLLASPFIIGGVAAFKASEQTAAKAADIALPIADAIGLPKDPVMLVKINAGVQIGGGILLALGFMPRITSLVLGASIIPTTMAGHRFWQQTSTSERNAQMIQFAKNAGMLGGLLALALDTGGRPSVLWSGKKAVGQAAQTVAESVGTAYHAIPGVS